MERQAGSSVVECAFVPLLRRVRAARPYSIGTSRRRPMKTSSDSAVSARLTAATVNGERGDDVGIILDTLRSIVRELRLASREAEQRVGVHGAQLHALRRLADRPATSLTALAGRARNGTRPAG